MFKPLVFSLLALVASVNSNAGTESMPQLGGQLGEFNIALGVRDPRCSTGTACFKTGSISVRDIDGAVSDVSLFWTSTNAPDSVEESRKRAQPFLPKDARKLKTYTSKYGALVDVYHSKVLSKQLPSRVPLVRLDGKVAGYSEIWDDEAPGTFIVLHSPRYKTTIAAGNNP